MKWAWASDHADSSVRFVSAGMAGNRCTVDDGGDYLGVQ